MFTVSQSTKSTETLNFNKQLVIIPLQIQNASLKNPPIQNPEKSPEPKTKFPDFVWVDSSRYIFRGWYSQLGFICGDFSPIWNSTKTLKFNKHHVIPSSCLNFLAIWLTRGVFVLIPCFNQPSVFVANTEVKTTISWGGLGKPQKKKRVVTQRFLGGCRFQPPTSWVNQFPWN